MDTQSANGVTYQVLQQRPGGWEFRWVLEYTSGVVKRGGWNADIKDAHLQACLQTMGNILRAFIEAMDKNRVYYRAVECPGADFCSFEWVHEGRIGGFGAVDSRVVGMTLLTRTERVTMLSCGMAEVNARPANELDNQFHFGAMP